MSAYPDRFGLTVAVVLAWLASAAADPPEPLRKLEHDGPVNVVTFSPDGKLVAAGDRDSTIRLWEPKTGKLIHKMQIPEGEFLSLSFAPNGKTLASTSTDGWIRLWDVEKGKQIREFHARERTPRGYVAFAPDGKKLASGAGDGIVSIWDAAMAKELYFSKEWERMDRIHSIAFLPGGRTVAALAVQYGMNTVRLADLLSRRVHLLDINTGKERAGFSVYGDTFTLSTDGKTLAIAFTAASPFARGEIHLMEMATGQERGRVGRRACTAFAFSPDNRFLALAEARDNPILIYDLITGKAVLRLEEHEAEIAGLAFSPDGKWLASAGGDLSVLLWDASSLSKRRPAEIELSEAELKASWERLAGADAAKAYQVRNRFLQAPKQAVPFLRAKLENAPLVDGKRLAQLIRDLDSKQFAVRQKAAAELENLGNQAEPALQKILDSKPSLEVRRRVENLLERIAQPQLTAEQLRFLRAVEVLELANTTEARALLKQLAASEPPTLLTHEAQMAVKRLRAATVRERQFAP